MPQRLDSASPTGVAAKDPLPIQINRLVRKGWRVESQTDEMATMVKGKRPNHLLHLILTVLTLGLWGVFVWLPLSIFKHEQRMVLTAP